MEKDFNQEFIAEIFIILFVLVVLASVKKDFPDHAQEQNYTNFATNTMTTSYSGTVTSVMSSTTITMDPRYSYKNFN